jgi:hypothetical protein
VLTTYDEATMITPLKIARSHYYLGRAYEQSGWTKKAAEQYNLVLEIWKDADSTLTEREDAAQRLAALGA